MRIAIVDDLETERAQLKARLARQLRLCGAEAELLEFESGESFLAAEKEQRFTAAFLDIYMHGMSGMDAAKELRKTDADCLLGFYHDLNRPRAGGLSGPCAPLSREAIFRGGAFRPACRDACKTPPPRAGPDGEGQRQRCPSLLPGHYLGRAFCTSDQHPHDCPENAGHPPEL